VRSGVGLLIADNVEEILRLERIAAARSRPQRVAVRVIPGVAGGTHSFVETGGADSKFGTPIQGGAALHAIRAVLAAETLRFAGLHAHVGSQLLASEPYLDAVDALLDLAKEACDLLGAETGLLDIGGGFGTTYTDEVPADVGRLAAAVLARVRAGAAGLGIQVPDVMVEPGRAIVANPVVTLYRVGAVKRGVRSFVAVDGGMSDNIRPALYGARYTVAPADGARGSPRERERFVVVGKHCESGDVLADDVSLPGDVSPGDVLAVAATGAYCYSMASNYNRLGRPAVVAVAGGRSALWVRRETEEDMDRFDVSGPDYHRNRTFLHEEQR
jgi:diaminopimelate decarboxylase